MLRTTLVFALCALCMLMLNAQPVEHVSAPGLSKKDRAREIMKDRAKGGWGSVLLKNEKEFRGMVWSNNDAVFVAQNGRTEAFEANKVVAFEFMDSVTNKQRIYISFNKRRETGELGIEFFEVIKQYDDFVVVRQRDQMLDVKNRVVEVVSGDPSMTYPNGVGNTLFPKRKPNKPLLREQNSSSLSYNQTIVTEKAETIYLARYEGEALPYIRFEAMDADRISGFGMDRTELKTDIVDKKLLETFFGVDYKKIVAVRDSKAMNLKDLDDLMWIFDEVWGK